MSTSTPLTAADWAFLLDLFRLPGKFISGEPYGSGHINDTFALTVQPAGAPVRYLLQRINDRIFKNVPALMENIQRVTAHSQARLAATAHPDAARRSLNLFFTAQGQPCGQDAHGHWWRCYTFIEGAKTRDLIEQPQQARAAARAIGEFQKNLTDLPGARLHETIPFFHHTRHRFDHLQAVIAADPVDRVRTAAAEIAFCREREPLVDRLLARQAQGDLPERITHNDTKLNNVMLDDVTGEGICVIDLDTVMPGLTLSDFGDMVRTATNAAAEDEANLSLVEARLPIFSALAEGYLSSAHEFLNPVERSLLVFAGRLSTYEQGIRFLSDYLAGDTYFKTRRPLHNLDRTRNQLALLRRLEHHADAMEAIIARCSP
jgi:aminoglycoside phosphotransferase